MQQKQKEGRKASVDTSASEVTDTNEAAVRRAIFFFGYDFTMLLYFKESSGIISYELTLCV